MQPSMWKGKKHSSVAAAETIKSRSVPLRVVMYSGHPSCILLPLLAGLGSETKPQFKVKP